MKEDISSYIQTITLNEVRCKSISTSNQGTQVTTSLSKSSIFQVPQGEDVSDEPSSDLFLSIQHHWSNIIDITHWYAIG